MNSPIPRRLLAYLVDFGSGLFSNPFSRGKRPGPRGVMTARDLGKSIQTAVLVITFAYLLGIVQALQAAPPDWVPPELVPVFLTLVATIARSLTQIDKHMHDSDGDPPGPPPSESVSSPFVARPPSPGPPDWGASRALWPRPCRLPQAALVVLLALAPIGCGVSPRPQPSAQPPAPSSVPTPEEFSDVNARLIDLHNAERARVGKSPLAPDGRLAMAAWLQARDCARRDLMSHTGSDGSAVGQRLTRQGYAWSLCAENAARQPRAPSSWPGPDVRTPEWAVDAWIKSPGHHANMVGPYTQMGAGWADSAGGTRYWTVCFGRP